MNGSELLSWFNAVGNLREVLQLISSEEVRGKLRAGYDNGFDSADVLLMFEDFYEILAPANRPPAQYLPAPILDALHSFYARIRSAISPETGPVVKDSDLMVSPTWARIQSDALMLDGMLASVEKDRASRSEL